ncbi:hypothetical protein DSO57_1024841, partial [Entomophthora muscae]
NLGLFFSSIRNEKNSPSKTQGLEQDLSPGKTGLQVSTPEDQRPACSSFFKIKSLKI